MSIKTTLTLICIFPLSFAATQNELHDFSPDKEPLLSMLEGEIQAMYMCKPGGWGLHVYLFFSGYMCAMFILYFAVHIQVM